MPSRPTYPQYYFVENQCAKCYRVVRGASQISEEFAKKDFQDTYLLHLQTHGLTFDQARDIVSKTIMRVDSCDSDPATAKT